MDISVWTYALLILKFVSYLSTSMVVGYAFIFSIGETLLLKEGIWPRSGIRQYCRVGLFAGVISALLQVPFLVLYFADSGIGGLSNNFMWQLVWSGSEASVTQIRLFAIGLVALSLFLSKSVNQWFVISAKALCVTGALMLVYSYSLRGHLAQASILGSSILAIHVLILTLWAGSLWPLQRACLQLDSTSLGFLMSRFGIYAQVPVLLLVVSGIYLVTQLLDNWTTLYQTTYGLLLSLKLLFVCSLLSIAAWHRFWLVPALIHSRASATRLAFSIRCEIALVVFIFLITAIFTTVTGPANH